MMHQLPFNISIEYHQLGVCNLRYQRLPVAAGRRGGDRSVGKPPAARARVSHVARCTTNVAGLGIFRGLSTFLPNK